MGVKNVLMEIQKRMKSDDKLLRERLLRREEYTRNVFGERSQQWYDAKDAVLRFDDVQLKERAVKFREFLDVNNEKATLAFCRLSKDGGLCDDIGQIKGEDGRTFNNSEERGKYIAGFYSKIYKKRLDNLFRIEDLIQARQDP
jgi:predicted alpha-1,6-mannanase (GH76 family)